jgi:hypothetical protein
MPHRPFVILVALLVVVGLPLYFVIIKRRAASTLNELLREQFKQRACPITIPIEIPSGGRVTFQSAYDDIKTGLALVLGSWDRGQVRTQAGVTEVLNDVAGLWKPSADEAWLAKARTQRDVIVATKVNGGGIVIWSGLPSKQSVLAHLAAMR